MNNQPVAWAYIKDGEFFDAIHPDEHDKYEGMYTTPLYTHPAKTQDEGYEVVFDGEKYTTKLKEPANKNPDSYMVDALNNTLNLERNHNEKAYKELYDFSVKLAKENEALKAKTLTDEEIEQEASVHKYPDWFDSTSFARAILRKAQEK